MAGTFAVHIDELAELVGSGRLVGSVVVDQVYAKYQHEGLDLKHPEGGKARYLADPVYRGHSEIWRRIAHDLLREGPVPGMIEGVEQVARGVYEEAPFEFGDLKASPHPTVTDHGSKVYDRPAMVHRLTERELRIKGHLRSIGLGNR